MRTRNFKINSRLRSTEERLDSILLRNGCSDYSELHRILLNTDDMKFLFRITGRCLDLWKKEKLLPYIKVNGKNYFRLSAVRQLLLERRYPKTSDS